jgi:hypothetical protein
MWFNRIWSDEQTQIVHSYFTYQVQGFIYYRTQRPSPSHSKRTNHTHQTQQLHRTTLNQIIHSGHKMTVLQCDPPFPVQVEESHYPNTIATTHITLIKWYKYVDDIYNVWLSQCNGRKKIMSDHNRMHTRSLDLKNYETLYSEPHGITGHVTYYSYLWPCQGSTQKFSSLDASRWTDRQKQQC